MKTIELATKQRYQAPRAEAIALAAPLSLLVSFSTEAGIDDWAEESEGI